MNFDPVAAATSLALSERTDSWRQYAIALLQFNAHKKYGTKQKDGKWVEGGRSAIISAVIYDADKLVEAENNLYKRRKYIRDNAYANQIIKAVFNQGCKCKIF